MPPDSNRCFISSPSSLVELAADPEGPRWARDCGWVPGAGYCRGHPCAAQCVFRAQREAEAARVIRSRRRRRRVPRASSGRLVGLATVLAPICDLIAAALAAG